MNSDVKEIQEIRNVTPSFLAPGGIAKAIVGVGKAKASLSVIQMIFWAFSLVHLLVLVQN